LKEVEKKRDTIGKPSLLHMLFFLKQSANQQKQLRNDAFHVKTSQSAKNSLILQKLKIGPKCYIRPFCTKAFNLKV